MDWKKISKALAGGIAAATTTTGTAYVMVPASANVPAWVYAVIPAINFIIGFAIVYQAPANTTSTTSNS